MGSEDKVLIPPSFKSSQSVATWDAQIVAAKLNAAVALNKKERLDDLPPLTFKIVIVDRGLGQHEPLRAVAAEFTALRKDGLANLFILKIRLYLLVQLKE